MSQLRSVVIVPGRLMAAVLAEAVRLAWPGAPVEVFTSGAAGLAWLRRNRARVALVDPGTEDLDGLDYLPEVIEERLALQVVVFTERSDEHTLRSVRRLACDGWIDARSASPGELRAALGAVEAGRRHVSRPLALALKEIEAVGAAARLTPHEERVLSLLGEGLDNETAGRRLEVSAETVRTHRARIMAKLELHHKGELMTYAHRKGYVRASGGRILHPGFEGRLRAGDVIRPRRIRASRVA